MEFRFRNVNDAYRGLVEAFHTGQCPLSCQLSGDIVPLETRASRAGEVIRITEPVMITYEEPTERVLFSEARDANPFFHLYEALWMLAGHNDVAPLSYYNSNISKIASDDGWTFNGAYGYRWRHARRQETYDPRDGSYEPVDQLRILIDHLKRNPDSRRAVLSMWNVEDDLLKIDSSKDVCCNLSVCFEVERGDCLLCRGAGKVNREPRMEDAPCPKCNEEPHDQPRYLHMTVFNRSNDMVWGALGANYVHFSILQEYVAAHLGLEVGAYNQISNNLHVYTERWNPERELRKPLKDDYTVGVIGSYAENYPLVENPAVFDRELVDFVEANSGRQGWVLPPSPTGNEPFFRRVQPLFNAFHLYKRGEYTRALDTVNQAPSCDWEIACRAWLERRELAHRARKRKEFDGDERTKQLADDNPYTATEQRRRENGTDHA